MKHDDAIQCAKMYSEEFGQAFLVVFYNNDYKVIEETMFNGDDIAIVQRLCQGYYS